MKQKIFTTAFCLLITISAFAYSGGNGTENNPYLISSKADMEQLATNVNGGQTYSGIYFKLTRDLTEASDTVTTVVGGGGYFGGIFDGDGHEIAVNRTGIFGNIQNAVIQNLGVSGSITTYSCLSSPPYYYYYGGGICAAAASSKIINCRNSARIESNYSDSSSSSSYYYYSYHGGICGRAASSQIINCWNSARVESNVSSSSSSHSYVAGICGWAASNNTIMDCYNTGLVSGTINNTHYSSGHTPYSHSGGICSFSNDYISNCYNTGNVEARSLLRGSEQANSWAGGICGYSANSASKINTCYNTGNISSYYGAGGISGFGGQIEDCFAANCQISNGADAPRARIGRIGGYDGTYTNCYADMNVSLNGDAISNSNENSKDGKDETLANLQSQSWLSSTLSWDFSVWKMIAGKFPIFVEPASISLALSEIVYGDQVSLNAVSDNNAVPVVYESSNSSIAEIVGSLLIAKKAGTVTITASQVASEGFFAGSTSTSLTILKKEVTVTANSATVTYGDALPAYSCSYIGFTGSDTESVLTAQPSFSCSATAQSNAGKYVITPSGAEAENYSFTYVDNTLTIQKRNLQVTPNNVSRQYGYANPSFTLSYEGFVNGNTEADISVKPTASTTAILTSHVNEYPIECSGGNAVNYDFTYNTGKLTVTKAPLTVSVSNASRSYGASNPPFTVTCSGFRNSDSKASLTVQPQATCEASEISNAASYPITVSGGESSNYEFTYLSGTLTVNKAPLTVTAQSVSSVYGDALPAYSCLYSGFVNNEAEDVLAQQPTFSCSATAQSNAGTYTITPSEAASQNYTFTYQSGTLTIQKRNLQVTPDDVSRVYGSVNPAFTLSYSGFVNGDTEANITVKPAASTAATVGSNVGEYPVTCSGGSAANYSFSYEDGILTVTKALLTASAGNVSRNYGTSNPAFSITYLGFKNSDTKASLTVQPQAYCTATSASNADTYPVIVSGGEAVNYDFSYTNGSLTVNKVPVTVIAQPATSVYGDTPPDYTCQYIGFVNGETESVLTQQPSLTCNATALSDAGPYSITPSNAEAQNYTFSYQPGTLTIQKRNLQVTPDNASRAYGDANPAFTLSYSGFVNGNNASGIGTKPTATAPATPYSNAGGEYTITCSGGSSTNYSFTYGTGTLTVTKAPLTATAGNASRNYGADNPAFSVSYSGFKNSETESVLDALPTISCDAGKDSPAGFYDIILSGGYDNNYDYQLVLGRLEVTLPSGMESVSVSKVSVYPNPVKHDLYIQSDYSIEKVEIYNQSGLCVLADEVFTGKIDVSSLPAGVYYMRIYTNGVLENRKIIVEK